VANGREVGSGSPSISRIQRNPVFSLSLRLGAVGEVGGLCVSAFYSGVGNPTNAQKTLERTTHAAMAERRCNITAAHTLRERSRTTPQMRPKIRAAAAHPIHHPPISEVSQAGGTRQMVTVQE
jgi:hypothetical protein